MSAHSRAIASMRYAAYHNDRKAWTRLYVENRVGLMRANAAWASGIAAKERGIPCGCPDCSEIGRAAQDAVLTRARQ